jgi:hypothetical protein
MIPPCLEVCQAGCSGLCGDHHKQVSDYMGNIAAVAGTARPRAEFEGIACDIAGVSGVYWWWHLEGEGIKRKTT